MICTVPTGLYKCDCIWIAFPTIEYSILFQQTSRLSSMFWVNESVVFKYTIISNSGLVFPQETVEHNGMGGDFEEVHKEVINMDIWTMLEEVKAMLFEDS